MDTRAPALALTHAPGTPAWYDEQLPVFVYGTLRTGQGNWHWALRGRTLAETPGAILPHARMHAGPGFPYVCDDPHSPGVLGDLMHADPSRWEAVRDDLDALEGFRPNGRSHYVRVRRTVLLPDGATVTAWTYLAGHTPDTPVVPGGDWLARPAR